MKVRGLIALLLALCLVLTSQAMALVRGASEATDQAVLCIGGAVVQVHLDAEGQPTQAPHYCPECALIALHIPAAPGALPVTGQFLYAAFYTAAAQHTPSVRDFVPQTRAPPFSV